MVWTPTSDRTNWRAALHRLDDNFALIPVDPGDTGVLTARTGFTYLFTFRGKAPNRPMGRYQFVVSSTTDDGPDVPKNIPVTQVWPQLIGDDLFFSVVFKASEAMAALGEVASQEVV